MPKHEKNLFFKTFLEAKKLTRKVEKYCDKNFCAFETDAYNSSFCFYFNKVKHFFLVY